MHREPDRSFRRNRLSFSARDRHSQWFQRSATIGNENATNLYAGAQSQYPGLDQINVQIPPDLKGRGRLSVVVTVNGRISNPVWITLA
jgi:uncharacterized protein (TIGR03437 family)